MKRNKPLLIKTASFIAKIIFFIFFLVIFIQSENSQTPQLNQIQVSPLKSQTSIGSVTESGLIDNKTEHQYKLIFPTNYEGRIKWKFEEIEPFEKFEFSSFVEQLNKAGEQGYKIIATSAFDTSVALVKLDNSQYEYDWFETKSSVFFAKTGFEEKQSQLAEKGFQLVNYLYNSFTDTSNSTDGEQIEYRDFFIVEKSQANMHPVQILIRSVPGWGDKSGLVLENQIKEKLNDGYYPALILSKYEVLLNQVKADDEILRDKPEIKVVTSSWGDESLRKAVNDLGKQGFRVLLTENGIVIMYRNSKTSKIPVSYIWLDAKKKSFDKDLTKLEKDGAVYKTIYPDKKGIKNTLIFEQPLINIGQQTEFKVLEFELVKTADQTGKKLLNELTPTSKENLETLNRLAAEGFEVRDLFHSGKTSLILERIR